VPSSKTVAIKNVLLLIFGVIECALVEIFQLNSACFGLGALQKGIGALRNTFFCEALKSLIIGIFFRASYKHKYAH
jgi:hypothetical protein